LCANFNSCHVLPSSGAVISSPNHEGPSFRVAVSDASSGPWGTRPSVCSAFQCRLTRSSTPIPTATSAAVHRIRSTNRILITTDCQERRFTEGLNREVDTIA
jgi:hypothetical protein